MENFLFSIVIILAVIIIYLLVCIIYQYENYNQVTPDKFYEEFNYINPLNFKSGDLIIVRSIGKIGAAIRTVTATDYNHSGILYFKKNIPYIYHSQPKGIVLDKLFDYVTRGGVEWFEIHSLNYVKKYHKRILDVHIEKFIDHKHGVTPIVLASALFQTDVYKKFGIKKSSINCAELMLDFYAKINAPISQYSYFGNPKKFMAEIKEFTKHKKRVHIPIHTGLSFLDSWRRPIGWDPKPNN